jgi:putative glutathione S-transferase
VNGGSEISRSTRKAPSSAPIYENVNNGVYRAGFATRQAPCEDAVTTLFATLEGLEERLGHHHQRYLCGERITEADWRLFTTLVRFDPVYHGHFKCNLRRLVDYPNLWSYAHELYQTPGVAGTCNFDQHQTSLLREPRDGESAAHSAAWPDHRFCRAP